MCPQCLITTESVCTIGSASDFTSRDRKFDYLLNNLTVVDIGHEIISMVIIPLLLIWEGQLSVTGESMCTSTG